MQLMRLGLTGPDAHPVFAGADLADIARQAAEADAGEVRVTADALRGTFEQPPVFGELGQPQQRDLRDPRQAGWTYVVAADDPDLDAVRAALRPLAQHRGMADPDDPLVVPAGVSDVAGWVEQEYLGMEHGVRPKYVLLVGDAQRLPFGLQVHWSSVEASVGRVAFSSVDDLAAYVDKLVRLETAPDPVPGTQCLVFAPDYGPRDPTSYSRRFMAEPVADLIRGEAPFAARLLAGADATKDALLEALTTLRSPLVYTASHGWEAPPADGLDAQRRLNGAICCARTPALDDMLLRAEDVPADLPVAEGGVVFQFACWGLGTPRESTFEHWLGRAGGAAVADEAFVAALPSRLLAHPRGPVGYVGHVDTAWLHGFDDPEHPVPELGRLYHRRLEPFLSFVRSALLRREPVGLALDDLTNRTALLSTQLADFFDQLARQGRASTSLGPQEYASLADSFVRRNDSMYFLVLGDPAARVRVGTPD